VEFQRGEFHAVQCYRYQALRTAKKGQHRIADLLQGRGWEVEIVYSAVYVIGCVRVCTEVFTGKLENRQWLAAYFFELRHSISSIAKIQLVFSQGLQTDIEET
jgi:hypothetical protein